MDLATENILDTNEEMWLQGSKSHIRFYYIVLKTRYAMYWAIKMDRRYKCNKSGGPHSSHTQL